MVPGGLDGEALGVGISLGEVRDDQPPHPRIGGQPAGLVRRHVAVPLGQVLVPHAERGLDHAEVDPVQQLGGRLADPSVHDERHRLPVHGLADVRELDDSPVEVDAALRPEPSDDRSRQPGAFQQRGHEPGGRRLLQPVADRGDPMVQRRGDEAAVLTQAQHGALVGDGHAEDVRAAVVLPDAEQPVDVRLGRLGVHEHHRIAALLEDHPLHDPGKSEAVVPVLVGDEDMADHGGPHVGQQHLSLRALAGVEQQPEVVPAQQVAVVVPVTGGCLAGRPEDDEFARHLDNRRPTGAGAHRRTFLTKRLRSSHEYPWAGRGL